MARSEDIQKIADGLNAAAKKGAEYRCRRGLPQPRVGSQSKINGTSALEYFETLLDPELVLEVGTYWVSVGGANAVDVLTSLGERVKYIHIKDGPLTTDNLAQLPAGQGKVRSGTY